VTTPFSRTYQALKADLNARLAFALVNSGMDMERADRWTPEDYAAQAEAIGDIVGGAQTVIGNLTTVDIARKFVGKVAPVGPSIGMRDNGIPKAVEYQRPFRVISKARADGKDIPASINAGLARLNALTDTDLQMAKVRQAQISLRAVGAQTYRRETTSEDPCELCEIAATQIYYTDQLMDIHPRCSCDIVPDDETYEDASEHKDIHLIARREHGEVGPMLVWRDQHFLGPSQLPHHLNPETFDRVALEESKKRQLEMMKKQLLRSIEHGGGKDFFNMTAIEERNAMLDRAREIADEARVAAPKVAAKAKVHAVIRADSIAPKVEAPKVVQRDPLEVAREKIAPPSDSESVERTVNYYWTSNFDDHKEGFREGAEEAIRNGYNGLPKLKAWDEDKFYTSLEGEKTIGAEMYSRILHADEVTKTPFFRGVTFNAADLAGYQEGKEVSLQLSSFGYRDAALKYMRGEYGFVSVDREGRDIPVLIRLEPGARVANVQEPDMLPESVTAGRFEVVSVQDNPNGYKQITLRQTSVIADSIPLSAAA
jgi:hypothetical protein